MKVNGARTVDLEQALFRVATVIRTPMNVLTKELLGIHIKYLFRKCVKNLFIDKQQVTDE